MFFELIASDSRGVTVLRTEDYHASLLAVKLI